MAVTGMRLERLLDVNPQEALPRRDVSTIPAPRPAARVPSCEDPDLLRDMEIFRMRTQPELYDGWMRDLIDDARADLAHGTGQFDWDCHTCKAAVMTYAITDNCPRCES